MKEKQNGIKLQPFIGILDEKSHTTPSMPDFLQDFLHRVLRTTSIFQATLFFWLVQIKMKFHVTTSNKHLEPEV